MLEFRAVTRCQLDAETKRYDELVRDHRSEQNHHATARALNANRQTLQERVNRQCHQHSNDAGQCLSTRFGVICVANSGICVLVGRIVVSLNRRT